MNLASAITGDPPLALLGAVCPAGDVELAGTVLPPVAEELRFDALLVPPGAGRPPSTTAPRPPSASALCDLNLGATLDFRLLATSIRLAFCCRCKGAVRRFEDFNSRLAEDLSLASDTDGLMFAGTLSNPSDTNGLIAGTLACSILNVLHLMRTYGWSSWRGRAGGGIELERWLGRDLG